MVVILVQAEPGDRQGTTSPGPLALLSSDHLPRLHHDRGLRLLLPDGDNWGDADNRLARDLVQGMLPLIGLFAYVEVRPHGRPSGLGSTLGDIADPRFRSLRVTDRQSVLGALDQLFGAEGA